MIKSPDERPKLKSSLSAVDLKAYKNVKVLAANNQVKELQTVLRDRTTLRSEFKFYADRLVRRCWSYARLLHC